MGKHLFALLFSVLVISSYACSCIRPPEFRQAVADAEGGDSPYAIAQVISEDRPADINGQVTYTLRPEGCTKTVIVTTCGNSACCGVRLSVRAKYVLRLKKNGTPSRVGSCGVFRQYDRLSTGDKSFVKKNVRSRCGAIKPVVIPPGIRSCAFVDCQFGYTCKFGRCVRQPNQCHRRCLRIACRPGQPCPVCNTVGCRPGWECKNGRCIRPRPGCYSACTQVQCIRAPCPPICRTIGCSRGYSCVRGKCVAPYPWYYDFFGYY